MWLRSGRNRFESATARKYRMMTEAVPAGYKLGKNLRGKDLQKGMKVVAYYNDTNEGVDVVEILGVTNNNALHGAGGVAFSSVKEMLKFHGVKTLEQVDTLDRESDSKHDGWGYHTYLYTRDLTLEQDSGAWYYIFEGRWCRGSGAEALSFVELIPTGDDEYVEYTSAKQEKPNRVNLVLDEE